VKFSKAVRPCCGHGIEASYDGFCTLLTCTCHCRQFCEHLQVTVPGEARRDERLGLPLYGWCRHCRVRVDDRHIRTLRPQRDSRMAIYWLGVSDSSEDELDAIREHELPDEPAVSTAAVEAQLKLF
jgi:hypothetical protein